MEIRWSVKPDALVADDGSIPSLSTKCPPVVELA